MDRKFLRFRLVREAARINTMTVKFALGLLIGMVLTLHYSLPFLRFSMQIRQPVNVLEPFLYICNTYRVNMVVFLGLLFLLSDAPFVRNRTLQVLTRTTRKVWNDSLILYIGGVTVFYYGMVLLVSILAVMAYGYVGNLWSVPMAEITAGNRLALMQYNLAFDYPELLSQNTPIPVLLESFAAVCLYGFTIGMVLYTFNLNSGYAVGAFLAVGIHAASYIAFVEGMDQYSLLSYSLAVLKKPWLVYFAGIIVLYVVSSIKCRYASFYSMDEG